jgi:hypothetical protein
MGPGRDAVRRGGDRAGEAELLTTVVFALVSN